MHFHYEPNRIFALNDQGNCIAEVTFPQEGEAVNINRTFVDPSLRGQGVAGKLMEAVVQVLQEKNQKAKPTCSYAVKWFEKHPQYAHLLHNQ